MRPVKEFDPDGFAAFWAPYPKHEAKKDAWKAWCQVQPSRETQMKIHLALSWQKTQPDWVKAGGAYVPLPASYLRGERWLDERRQAPRRAGDLPPTGALDRQHRVVPKHEPL